MPLKSILIATRVFAVLTLLFVPSFLVMIAVGVFVPQPLWFGTAALTMLLVNVVVVLVKPVRDAIWRWACGVAGTPTRIPPAKPWPALERAASVPPRGGRE